MLQPMNLLGIHSETCQVTIQSSYVLAKDLLIFIFPSVINYVLNI